MRAVSSIALVVIGIVFGGLTTGWMSGIPIDQAFAQGGTEAVPSAKISNELKELADTAEAAARNDNCIRKNVFINRLWEIRQDGNNPFWVRNKLDGESPSLNATRREFYDFIEKRVAEINAIPCPRRTAATSSKTEVQIGGGGGVLKLPKRGFLGVEFGGVPRVGLATVDNEPNGPHLSGSLRFNNYNPDYSWLPQALSFGGLVVTWFEFNFFYAEYKGDQKFGAIDPGAGGTLLIPGPTGGASGFALGAHPLNVVRDASYSADLKKGGGALKTGQTVKVSNDLSLGISASAGYAHKSFDERFAGSIPGFARNFAYASSVDVDQARLRVGAELSLTSRPRWSLVEDIRIRWGASVEVGPDISRASGSDRLSFTGFPDSSVNLGKSKTDVGFGAGLSLGVEMPNGLKFAIDGRYMRETGLPVLERDGTNPTRLELKSGHLFTGMGRVSVPIQ